MYVKRIFYDNPQDVSSVRKLIKCPTWEQVEEIIDKNTL